MGRLVGEMMKIAEEESVKAEEISPVAYMCCKVDTLGNISHVEYLVRTSDSAERCDSIPVTPHTQKLLEKAVERLGVLIPAERNGRKVPYVLKMHLRIPIERLVKKQETDPLLFEG